MPPRRALGLTLATLPLLLAASLPAEEEPWADTVLSSLADFRFEEARAAAAAANAPETARTRLALALAGLAAQPLTDQIRAQSAAQLRAVATDAAATPDERAAAAYFEVRVDQWHSARHLAAPDPARLEAIALAHPQTFFGNLAALKAATARLTEAQDETALLSWISHYEAALIFRDGDHALRRNLHLLLADAFGRLRDDARAVTHLANAYALGTPHRTSAKQLLTRLINLNARTGEIEAARRWLAEFERNFPHDVLVPQLRTVIDSSTP